jgi:2-keto-4-pentenoate hydratase/2-oxohepta-3-ene-1,7-dioic acid hydratase in catechol pathway
MRYAKIQTPGGPTYVSVEERGGELFATHACEAPEEDPLPAQSFPPGLLSSFSLLPPVKPSKIVCVGRNYKDHAAEMGNDVPREPLLFLKAPSSLLAPEGVIRMPALSSRVDFEGEIAIVIGKRLSRLGADADPREYIRGYVLVNDVTARDLQKSDGQWTRAKGWDTFCPCGPFVAVAGPDEIDLFSEPVTLTTRLNGAVRQSGSTADLIFPIPELLRYISACMTLEPGDLIPTGTPAGVGPMQPGDTVEVAIEGMGILRNTTAAE